MKNKIYVNQSGQYLGEFSLIKIGNGSYVDNPAVPDGSIEVNSLPSNATDIWNSSNSSWEKDIHLLKSKKKSAVSERRSRLSEKSTVTHNGKTYANSQNARIAIINYIQSLPNTTDTVTYFTYPEREVIQLNRTDFETIRNLIKDNELALRISESNLYTNINSAVDVAALEAINIE